MTVHFPVFLMNHVAILRPQHWPRGIIVNWYITSTGGKISKSKGGALPIPDAAERFGVDAMRLFYAHISSLYVDVAWEDEKVEGYRDRLGRIWGFSEELMSIDGSVESDIDSWLHARLQTRLANLHSYMAEYDMRSYSNDVYFEIPQDLRWYVKRGGNNKGSVRKALETWIALMTPVTPHLAEELWERLGKSPFVSLAQLPEGHVDESVLAEEAKEKLLGNLMADVAEILKVTEIKAKKIVLMTSPAWKHDLMLAALAQQQTKFDMSALIRTALQATASAEAKKAIPAFAKEIVAELPKLSSDDRRMLSVKVDELAVLTAARAFLQGQFGCEVSVFSAENPAREDPKGKAKFARPGRPAIYIVS